MSWLFSERDEKRIGSDGLLRKKGSHRAAYPLVLSARLRIGRRKVVALPSLPRNRRGGSDEETKIHTAVKLLVLNNDYIVKIIKK